MNVATAKIEVEIPASILSELSALSRAEGAQLTALVEEALVDLLAKRKMTARPYVMDVYQKSHEQFGELYKKLAE